MGLTGSGEGRELVSLYVMLLGHRVGCGVTVACFFSGGGKLLPFWARSSSCFAFAWGLDGVFNSFVWFTLPALCKHGPTVVSGHPLSLTIPLPPLPPSSRFTHVRYVEVARSPGGWETAQATAGARTATVVAPEARGFRAPTPCCSAALAPLRLSRESPLTSPTSTRTFPPWSCSCPAASGDGAVAPTRKRRHARLVVAGRETTATEGLPRRAGPEARTTPLAPLRASPSGDGARESLSSARGPLWR